MFQLKPNTGKWKEKEHAYRFLDTNKVALRHGNGRQMDMLS